MIYEFRTYGLVPGGLPEFLALFAQALPKREEFSRMAAFWYTEIGPLNEIIHVWPYRDAVERARVRAGAVQAGVWPPPTAHLIRTMRSDILDALPGIQPFPARARAAYIEMSTQLLKPFALAKVGQIWGEYARGGVPEALLGVFASDVGQLNTSMQIWAYDGLDDLAAARRERMARPELSRSFAEAVVEEECKLLVPAPFPLL